MIVGAWVMAMGLNLMVPCRERGSANFAGQDCRRKARGAERKPRRGASAGQQGRAGRGDLGEDSGGADSAVVCLVSSVFPFPSRRFSRMRFSSDRLSSAWRAVAMGGNHGWPSPCPSLGVPARLPRMDFNTARAPAMRECAG